ncbi:hypothetical protein BL254_09090 [Protofrankia sp. BMG5.30]|uniref:Uncharacterized protein n=1 Tax=Protofrankia coriariae TaxID=1562887 RepID=A0ABR5F024_9ACTN|nr:hypothetical protein FrCorBMG51_20270 [Protofrankia coriariae]ONH36004.1 hypothetical protein BL254_09090 [Protofrankia sp. BMG5.30]
MPENMFPLRQRDHGPWSNGTGARCFSGRHRDLGEGADQRTTTGLKGRRVGTLGNNSSPRWWTVQYKP